MEKLSLVDTHQSLTTIMPSVVDLIDICVSNSVKKAMSEFTHQTHTVVHTTTPDTLCLLKKTQPAFSYEVWTAPSADSGNKSCNETGETESVYYEMQCSEPREINGKM